MGVVYSKMFKEFISYLTEKLPVKSQKTCIGNLYFILRWDFQVLPSIFYFLITKWLQMAILGSKLSNVFWHILIVFHDSFSP